MNFLKERNEELNVEIRCEGHTDDAVLPSQSESFETIGNSLQPGH